MRRILWILLLPFRFTFACLLLGICSLFWLIMPSTYDRDWPTLWRQIVMADFKSLG